MFFIFKFSKAGSVSKDIPVLKLEKYTISPFDKLWTDGMVADEPVVILVNGDILK